MLQAIAFYFIAACILGFAVLVVSTKDTVHSVLFLVVDFLFVSALYVLLGAQFLAVIQVLVSDPHARNHPTHAIALLVAAVACLVAANFARPKTA